MQKQHSSPKVNKLLSTEKKKVFYIPQVSINCLACPKGVEYEIISDAQAVSTENGEVNALNPFFA
jgi:hypothetical protein